MKYKNIFITGSTGVVGKPLLKKLIENGHNVYALSRSEENNKILESQGVSVISGKILTSNLVDQFENINIDAIFHVAGVNKMCSKNPQYMFDANIDGTKNILNLGNQLGISKFVYTSSAVTLGEDLGSIGNESSTHRGYYLSKYEESKFLAEKEAFNFEKNFEFVSVNPSSVQGPGRVSGTAKLLISTLSKTNPPLIRNNISIVDIDDCTEGHYNALEFGKNNERYVLNSFQTTSEDLINKLNVINILSAIVSRNAPIFEVIFHFLARRPSKKSVHAAIKAITAGTNISPSLEPSKSSKYRMTGAEIILKTAKPSGIYFFIKSRQLFFVQKLF